MRPVQITIEGITKSLSGWAKQVGITREAMRLRVQKWGPDAGSILIQAKQPRYIPLRAPRKSSKHIRTLGRSIAELARINGLTPSGLKWRLKYGKPFKQG